MFGAATHRRRLLGSIPGRQHVSVPGSVFKPVHERKKHQSPVVQIPQVDAGPFVGGIVSRDEHEHEKVLDQTRWDVREQLAGEAPSHGGRSGHQADKCQHPEDDGDFVGTDASHDLGKSVRQARVVDRLPGGRCQPDRPEEPLVADVDFIEFPFDVRIQSGLDVSEHETVIHSHETGVGADDEPPVVVEVEDRADGDPRHHHADQDGDADECSDKVGVVEGGPLDLAHLWWRRDHDRVVQRITRQTSKLDFQGRVHLEDQVETPFHVRRVAFPDVGDEGKAEDHGRRRGRVHVQLPVVAPTVERTDADPNKDGHPVRAYREQMSQDLRCLGHETPEPRLWRKTISKVRYVPIRQLLLVGKVDKFVKAGAATNPVEHSDVAQESGLQLDGRVHPIVVSVELLPNEERIVDVVDDGLDVRDQDLPEIVVAVVDAEQGPRQQSRHDDGECRLRTCSGDDPVEPAIQQSRFGHWREASSVVLTTLTYTLSRSSSPDLSFFPRLADDIANLPQ